MNPGPDCSTPYSPDFHQTHQSEEDEALLAIERFCQEAGPAADEYLKGKAPFPRKTYFVSDMLSRESPLLEAVSKLKNAMAYLHSHRQRIPFTRICENAKGVCKILSHCVGLNDRKLIGRLVRHIKEWEDFLQRDRDAHVKDIAFGEELDQHFKDVTNCVCEDIREAIIDREEAIAEGVAERLPSPSADDGSVPIGPAFSFITYCNPTTGHLKLKLIQTNGETGEFTLRITGDERWHYILQFVSAETSPVRLVPYQKGKPIKLGLVFRGSKDNVFFYRLTRASSGANASYWLEQLKRKPPQRQKTGCNHSVTIPAK